MSCVISVALLFLLLINPALAALGDAVDTGAESAAKAQVKRAVTQRSGFTVRETTQPDGTVIREYVSPNGRIFGVAWSAFTMPDLTELLGTHDAEFRNSLRTGPGQRRVAAVRNTDLVVESFGHTRAFRGRAYLNSLLPAGVGPEVVQ